MKRAEWFCSPSARFAEMDHIKAQERRRRIVADWNAGLNTIAVAIRHSRTPGAIGRQLAIARAVGWKVRETDRSAVSAAAYAARAGQEARA